MTSSCDKLRRALLSSLSRPADCDMQKFAPRGGAEGTEERVLVLHVEKLAKEIDESASVVVVFRQSVKSNALMHLSMVGYYMKRSLRSFPTYKDPTASAETMGVRCRRLRHGPMTSSLEQKANENVFGGGRMCVGRGVSSRWLARVWMVSTFPMDTLVPPVPAPSAQDVLKSHHHKRSCPYMMPQRTWLDHPCWSRRLRHHDQLTKLERSSTSAPARSSLCRCASVSPNRCLLITSATYVNAFQCMSRKTFTPIDFAVAPRFTHKTFLLASSAALRFNNTTLRSSLLLMISVSHALEKRHVLHPSLCEDRNN